MHIQERINNKILSLSLAVKTTEELKQKGLKIVFTNGCFDILHLGHIDYLSKASQMGDFFVVALNTDASVKKLKGPKRPINHQTARAKLLASLFFVDAIVLFEEDTPIKLIEKIKPDVLVKGSDYKVEEIVGYDIVKSYGGDVTTIALLDGYSTTAIETKISESRK